MPGPRLDGAGLTELMAAEGVAACYGVPTVHIGLLQHWKDSGERVPSLRLIGVGGAAPTRSLVEAFRALDIDVVHGWGMTETSPVGALCQLGAAEARLAEDEKWVFSRGRGARASVCACVSSICRASIFPTTAGPWASCRSAGRGCPVRTSARSPEPRWTPMPYRQGSEVEAAGEVRIAARLGQQRALLRARARIGSRRRSDAARRSR